MANHIKRRADEAQRITSGDLRSSSDVIDSQISTLSDAFNSVSTTFELIAEATEEMSSSFEL